MVLEEGTKTEGNWVNVSKDEITGENVIYELQFKITSLIPLPDWGWVEFLDSFRKKVSAYLIQQYYEKFKGLEIMWWRLTDDKFNIQVRRKTEEKPTTGIIPLILTLKLIIIATTATLAIIAVWATFESAKKLVEIIPTPLKEGGWPWWTGPAILLGGIFILGSIIMKPKKEG